ncbi:FGGY family carbohydrate kinase [Nakamurella flavida]
MSVLGIDLGTSGCRVVAYDTDLVEIAGATGHYAESHPRPGIVELDARHVHAAVDGAVRAVAARVGGDRITALAIATLGEALVPWGRGSADPLAVTPLGSDRRGTDQLARFLQAMPADELRARTGAPVHPMFGVWSLAWWREHAPWWPQLTRITDMAGSLLHHWGIEPAVDYTLAARTQAFAVDARRWDTDILAAVDVDPALLPTPVPVGTPLGTLPSAVAAGLGLTGSVQAVAGAHDQTCALWGSGLVAPHRSGLSLGTTECLTSLTRGRPDGLIESNISAYPSDDGDTWVTLAGVPAGGSNLLWLAGLNGTDPTTTLSAVMERLPAEPSPVLALAHFLGSGTVENDAGSRGAFLGLTHDTTSADLVLALIEASGHEMVINLAALHQHGHAPRDTIRVTGGGIRSRRAVQARADAAGVPLQPVAGHTTARGAAMVAGAGTGVWSDLAQAAALVHPQEIIDPDPAVADWHAGRRRQYALLSPALRAVQAAAPATLAPLGPP